MSTSSADVSTFLLRVNTGKICCSAWSLAIYLKHSLVSWLMQIQTLLTPPSHGERLHSLWNILWKVGSFSSEPPLSSDTSRIRFERGGGAKDLCETTISLWMDLGREVKVSFWCSLLQEAIFFQYFGLGLWRQHYYINHHFFINKLQTLLISNHTSISVITTTAPCVLGIL